MTRAPLRGGDLRGVDLVLASHKHSDHLDPGTLPDLHGGLARRGPRPPRVDPSTTRWRLGLPARPADRRSTPACSRGARRFPRPRDPFGPRGARHRRARASSLPGVRDRGRRAAGSIIAATAWRTTGWPSWLGADRFDVLFLPINGRDPARGVPGNMSAAEAVDLAARDPAAVRRAASLRHVYLQYGPRRGVRVRGPPAPRGGRGPGPPVRGALGDHAVSVTLGIDIGTSGTKTLAIDERGTILGVGDGRVSLRPSAAGLVRAAPGALVGRDGPDGATSPGRGQGPRGGRRRRSA